MRRLSWLVLGVGLGFVAAHFVNQSPEGRRFFDRINRGTQEFSRALASGYRAGEAEFEEALDDVERRLRDLEAKQ